MLFLCKNSMLIVLFIGGSDPSVSSLVCLVPSQTGGETYVSMKFGFSICALTAISPSL